jgi:GntR family transcriptional regulator
VINMRSDRPAYKQLADLLRQQIISGELAPGAPLPSEARLMQELGVSRNTVRLAVQLLRSEGHVTTEHGRGTYVREKPPVRRLGPERYRADVAPQGEETSFTRDHGIDWSEYRLEKVFREVPASERLALLLDVPEGTVLLERHFTFYARNEPEQISLSVYPLDLVAGTPVADPEREPWPGGNIAQLATIGIAVTRVEEQVTARMPMPDEAETLIMDAGVPVLAITRRMFADDRPVEVADIVIPADRVALDYVIDLPGR